MAVVVSVRRRHVVTLAASGRSRSPRRHDTGRAPRAGTPQAGAGVATGAQRQRSLDSYASQTGLALHSETECALTQRQVGALQPDVTPPSRTPRSAARPSSKRRCRCSRAGLRRHDDEGDRACRRRSPRRWSSSTSRARPHSTRRSSGGAARATRARAFAGMQPSTATLVHMVRCCSTTPSGEGEIGRAQLRHRLIVQSFLDDGEYARLVQAGSWSTSSAVLRACLEAAAAARATSAGRPAARRFWFAHHVAAVSPTGACRSAIAFP